AEKPPPEKPPEKGLSLAEPEPDCDPKGSPAEEPYGSCDDPRPPKRPPKVPPPRLGWTKTGSRSVAEPLSPVETAEAGRPGPSAGAQPARPSTTDRSPGPTRRSGASAEARSCSRPCLLLAGYFPASASPVGGGSEEPGNQLGLPVRRS